MVCFSSQLIAHTSHKLPTAALGHYDHPSVDLCGHLSEMDGNWPVAATNIAHCYRRFIPHFADLSARLSDLTKKDQPQKVRWSEQLEMDFQRLKEQMCTRPVLHCPREEGQFILQTDASKRGIGAVLSQDTSDGEDRPVAFFSKKLLPRETRYSTVEKECLALVAAIKHFDVHLVGRHFKIVTDHS